MWDRRRPCQPWPARCSSRGSPVSGSFSCPHHSAASTTSLLWPRHCCCTSTSTDAGAGAASPRKAEAASANYNHHKAYSSLSSSRSRSQFDLNLSLDLDHPLSAFGITTDVTHKYRILNGKAVPQSLYPQDSYSSPLDYSISPPSSPELQPPPRNPRRLQQLRYHTAFAPTRSSSIYSTDDSSDPDDASPTTIRHGPGALAMPLSLAIEPVSPPSSPEIASWRIAPQPETVSPVDEDEDASLENFVQAIKGISRGVTPPTESPHYRHIPAGQRHLPSRHLPSVPRHGPTRASGIDQAPAYQQELSHRKPISDENASWRPQLPLQRQPGNALMQRPPQQTFIPERDSSFGMRSKQAGKRTVPVDARPPWHGASGREQQVSAMRDDLSVPPLSLPTKAGKRGEFRSRLSHIGTPRADGTSVAGAAMRKFISSRTHKKTRSLATQSPRAQFNIDAGEPGPDSYPSPPYQDRYNDTATRPSLQHSPGQSITIKRKPPPSAHMRNYDHAHPLTSSPINEHDLPNPLTPESPTAQQVGGDSWIQPASRFSTTTYATTTRGMTSIESSPAAGMEPNLPGSSFGGPVLGNENLRSVSDAPFATRSALMSRPESSASNKTTRKSTDSRADGTVATPRRASLSSMSKPLPPAPPEVSASDKIAHLTAQVESLSNRRLNINRCVTQMTELIPMDNLLDSKEVQKKREMEREKIAALKVELAEVQREEHKLGLMLHRAWKRQMKEDDFEPPELWIRRVAG